MYDYLWIARWVIFGVISFYIVYRCNTIIRNLALRMIPVRRRIRHDSYRLQSRYAIIMSFTVGIALTLLFNLGFMQVSQEWSTEETVVTIPTTPSTPPQEQGLKLPTMITPPPTPLVPQTISVRDTIVQLAPVEYTTISQKDYLQVNAFSSFAAAERYEQEMQQQHEIGTRVVYLPATAQPPYKVLLGPFTDRRSVLNYNARYGLRGFPRQLNE